MRGSILGCMCSMASRRCELASCNAHSTSPTNSDNGQNADHPRHCCLRQEPPQFLPRRFDFSHNHHFHDIDHEKDFVAKPCHSSYHYYDRLSFRHINFKEKEVPKINLMPHSKSSATKRQFNQIRREHVNEAVFVQMGIEVRRPIRG